MRGDICSLLLVCCGALPAQTPWLRVAGGSPGAQMGRAVAFAGDLDRDGYADLALGLPQLGPTTAPWRGEVVVVSGRDGVVLRTYTGSAAGDRFGMALVSLGDVDNDGFPDLAVGAPYDDVPGQDAGTVSLWSGRSGSLLRVFSTALPGENFGGELGNAGDVDRDGADDLVVGCPFSDVGGRDSGTAYVFSARTGQLLHRWTGAAQDRLHGFAVAGVGDLDGDGSADVAVSAYEMFVGGRGTVEVRSGRDGRVLHSWRGDQLSDLFGHDVAGAGDVDGDGVGDVVVGIFGQGTTQPSAGAMRVHSGRSGQVLASFAGFTSFDRFGASVAGVGDTDGDGRAEWVVGSLFSNYAVLFDGATRQPRTVLRGTGFFGSVVSGGQDATGDGRPDLVVGSWKDSGAAAEAGAAQVFSGQTVPLQRDVPGFAAVAGGQQVLSLEAGAANSGRVYLILGSVSGTRPGTPVLGGIVPLVFDAYTSFTLGFPNMAPLVASLGTLDAQGKAVAAFRLPAGLAGLAGLRLDHAALLAPQTSTLDFVSNPVPLLLR